MGSHTRPARLLGGTGRALALVAAVAAWCCGGAAPSPTAARPNVLLILPDQFRADVIGAYGGADIATPNLDRLAREGVLFEHALSTTPLCTPYRGMLMTGRYPTHSGLVMNWVDASPAQNPEPIARVFAAAGYRTGFVGKWHLSAGIHRHSGAVPASSPIRADLLDPYQEHAGRAFTDAGQAERFARALDLYRGLHPSSEFVPPGPGRLGFEHWRGYNFHGDFRRFWYYADTPERIQTEGYETDVVTDLAIEFIAAGSDDPRPFFLVVAPHPPHPPFSPAAAPEGYLDRVPLAPEIAPNVPSDHPLRSDPTPLRVYLAMAMNTDDNVGRLLRQLDESGLARDTVVVFTSDHGEMHGSHGRSDKMVPYREAVDVPLLMRWPGRILAGVRVPVPQTPMDHLPTLAGLAGVEPPVGVDGADLSSVLLGTGTVEREAVLMASYTSHWDFFQTRTLWPEWRGVHTGDLTYVRWIDGAEELYDNRTDPYQLRSLAGGGDRGALLDDMRSRLERLLRAADDTFPPGTAYADWYDSERRLVRTALGPVPPTAGRADEGGAEVSAGGGTS